MRRLVVSLVLVLSITVPGSNAGGAGRGDGAPLLLGLNVTNGGAPFAGDGRLLTTITPNRDGLREQARIHFRLREPAVVRLVVCRTLIRPDPVYARAFRLAAGRHTLVWAPARTREPRTYLARLFVRDRAGNTRRYGAARAHDGRDAPVIRVLGLDAAFDRTSYRPGADARLRIATDAPEFDVQFFRSGLEYAPTPGPSVMRGIPASEPLHVDWRWRNRPRTLRIRLPAAPSGFYYARLSADDGRVGYAPFVVRPSVYGSAARVAVVLPTNTWQAYNFYDADGNGWGDTWYAGPSGRPAVQRIGTHRPFLSRGVPPHFRLYDLAFLHWLAWTGKPVDYLADPDVSRFRTGGRLRKTYDLVIFPGHEEYVTAQMYRIVRRFRDLGGNLAFLSANNFYWRVVADGGTLRRSRPWRDLGLPEAALIGIQYRGNDQGRRQRPYHVIRARRAAWLFAGTGLGNGSRFGHFGIEVDGRAAASPRGTVILAQIKHIFGHHATAQMSYYVTRRGARVFAFGAFTLAGGATQPLNRTLLENLWAHLAER